MGLKHIKSKIYATDKTRKVTRAMEAVSAVKMRKGQERAIQGRPYAYASLRILERMTNSIEGKRHLLAQKRKINKRLFVVITSDKGLAGNLNSAVLKKVESAMRLHPDEGVGFICLGKKAYEYFSYRGHTVEYHHVNISDEVTLEEMGEISQLSLKLFTAGTYDAISVVYQNFKSTFEQQPVVRRILPLSQEAIIEIIEGITPTKGLYADDKERQHIDAYTVEPDAETVLEILIPYLVQVLFYHCLIEAKASEHSARMVAMKNASDKALEVSDLLKLKFNKERQAVITREVSEISGGIEAMAQK